MLSKLFSIFSHKKAHEQNKASEAVNPSGSSLYDALCDELRARHFRSLPNGQAIDGYADADLYIHFVRNGHDVEIMIDEEEISVVVDEETDQPAEYSLKMEDFSATGDIYQAIYSLTGKLCGKDAS